MVIEFDPVILQSLENYNQFGFLFNLFYLNRRYDFFIDVTQINESPIYNRLTSGDKDLIAEYFNKFITTNPNIDYLISDQTDDEVFNLDEGIIYFNQPVSIVLENNLNDKYFLEAIANKFSKRGAKINRHLHHRWISFENGGGCTNIQNVIAEKIDTFNGLPKAPQAYLRCLVIIDSDSTYPGELLESRRRLRAYLDANGINYHFLIKREMENYLPDEIYDEISENTEYISSYLRLTPVQKDYFDIQNGFDRNLDSYSSEIKLLYKDIPSHDMSVFRKGGLKMHNFKTEFPKLFQSAKVTQENLKKRVEHQGENANELETILNKINELL